MSEWLGNALVFERNREDAQLAADGARKRGDPEMATRMQETADSFAAMRDREQRMELRRQANRRTFRRY